MSEPQPASAIAVVLIGHGAPATDCPPQLVGELMSLEWRSNHAGPNPQLQQRAAALDAQIRQWPRHAGNDPYQAGLERIAQALRPLLPTALLAIGYNEFCQPTIPAAIAQVIRQGAGRILVIPSMLTPGGRHAERDIPQALEEARRTHPNVAIEYCWPFDVRQVASLLAAHIQAAMTQAVG